MNLYVFLCLCVSILYVCLHVHVICKYMHLHVCAPKYVAITCPRGLKCPVYALYFYASVAVQCIPLISHVETCVNYVQPYIMHA